MDTAFPLIDAALRPLADPARAAGMSAYMRGRFPFLGVATPDRRAAVKEVLRGRRKAVDREFVEECWAAAEREFQYVACDHLREVPLGPGDVAWLRSLVVRKSWWDTVDALAKPVGRAATAEQMRDWAVDGDLWVRRVAILHQLGWKADTDEALLAEIIRANLGSGGSSSTRPSVGPCVNTRRPHPAGCGISSRRMRFPRSRAVRPRSISEPPRLGRPQPPC